MNTPLRILILEDSADDVDLLERELRRGGIEYVATIVKRKDEYERALMEFNPDIILSDHSLPQFNSIEAMELWKNFQKTTNTSIPFILITGSVSEEFAVQSIKAGADDYILKDRLKRLPSSIQSALERARLAREREKFISEILAQSTLMKEAEALAHFGSWQVDLDTGKHQWSDEAFRIFGFEPGEIEPNYETFLLHVHPEDRPSLKRILAEVTDGSGLEQCEYRIVDHRGNEKTLLTKIIVKRDANGRAYQLVGFTMDVTEQKKQTQALELQNQKLMEIAWVQSHEVRGPLARLMGLIQLLNKYPHNPVDLKETLGHVLQSAKELDEIVRKVVRKTEEIV